ncbi:Bug family tripartite tricarboxylate transporter substrate binding protein [Roseomonas xinghualingensis]|uniref:Bug family tripartite tricarboxylate transporter substrate binding protein n=1 Tax=Roseomonas xinghualingensis TaxID=2986475 RepID=UPI0021F10185|nr:tripartite tricarboxylate transporter substrate binding protein [Roseomonas sp. SXEYE001]MCV4207717.1 tripartite tricarboxylate transporter substrate binding protein [Roseomonas sp. SXEYE001]
MITRRSVFTLATALAMPAAARAQAAWAPGRPVTLVVPYPAGGPTDVLARLVAGEIAKDLGSPVVVENVAGGGGSIGARRVATGPSDGTSIMLASNQTHATNISLLPDGGGYDPVKDFAPLAGLADLQHILVVRPDVPAKSVEELLALVRSQPGKITCASTGQGSASHLTLELFRAKTGADMVHVPYRGSSPMLNDLLGGHVQVSFATTPTILSQVQSGALRALAVASPNRSPHLPELPTMAQAGVAGVEADAWFGLFAPSGVPAPALARLRELTLAAIAREPVRVRTTEVGMTVNMRDAATMESFLKEDIARWAEVIRTANVKPG